MIVWGSGGERINLGQLTTHQCQTCEKPRAFHLILQYRYWGLYWIFNFVTEKNYLLACEVCHHGWALAAREVEPKLPSVPIPFMRRYGLLMLIGLGTGMAFLSSLSGR